MELIAPDGKISETFFPPKSFVILSINLSALNAEAGDYRRFFALNKKFMRAPIFFRTRPTERQSIESYSYRYALLFLIYPFFTRKIPF